MAIATVTRRRHWRRWLVGLFVALVVAAAIGFGANAPAMITVAALVPGACFATLAALLDRRSPRPWFTMLAALVWGGTVAAFGAQVVNDMALRSLPRQWVSALLAPLIEEAFKGSVLLVVLLVWRDAWRGVRAAIIYAMLAGIGFAVTENLGYYVLAAVQGGSAGLARAVYLRGLLEGLNHAIFTAPSGAAAGYARAHGLSRSATFATVLGGLALSVLIHALWNAALSPQINDVLCNASAAGGACTAAPDSADLLLRVPALVASFIAPTALLLALLVRRTDADALPGNRGDAR